MLGAFSPLKDCGEGRGAGGGEAGLWLNINKSMTVADRLRELAAIGKQTLKFSLPWSFTRKLVVTRGGTCPLTPVTNGSEPRLFLSSSIT